MAFQADEAQFHFMRGNRAYQENRYEDALDAWYQSNRLVPNRNVQFNIARCLEKLARYDEAFRAWSTLQDSPLPEEEQKIAHAAIMHLRPFLALLEITSDPPSATIYAQRYDLGALGRTPKLLALPPGTTSILLEQKGFRPVNREIELVRGKHVALHATLEPIHGKVTIRQIPENAEVRRDFLDGPLLHKGPGTFLVIPGSMVLFVSASGYQTERVPLTALPDENTILDVILTPVTPPTGALVVRSNIVGSLIRLDKKEAGFCPAVIEGVPVGSHQVEIEEEGRAAYRTQVEIHKDQRRYVDGYLGKAQAEVTAATKSRGNVDEAPASISILTADEIAAMGYTSLTQALEAVRGTFTSNDRSYESVGFRGFSPPGDYTNRVLVLVDGHVVNDAVTGQGYVGHDLDVDLANVARIEVVRGPGSILYGTGALFGVINVVTRRSSEGTHAKINTSLGSLGLASGRATASIRHGDSEVMISAAGLYASRDRRYTWEPTIFPGTTPVLIDTDTEQARHADLWIRHGTWFLRAAYNDRKKQLPTGAYFTNPVPGSYLLDHRAYVDLRYEHTLGPIRVAARGAYDTSWFHGRFITNAPVDDSDEKLSAHWTTGELRFELPQILRQRLTIGAELVNQLVLQTVEPTGDPIPREIIVSGYLVDVAQIHTNVQLNVGLRLDRHTLSFGNVLTPRLALILKPYRSGNTKVLLGRSFRAPSPYERASSQGDSLQPELIWNGEIEHSHMVSDDTQVLFSAFLNDLSQLIVVNQTESLGALFLNMPNRISGRGVEGELRWEPGGGTHLSLSAAFQRIRVHSPAGETAHLNSPEILVKGRALVPLWGPSLRLGAEVFLDSGRHFRTDLNTDLPMDNRVDDTILCNLTLSGEHRAFRLRYFLGISNVFDVHDRRSGFPTSADYRSTLVPRYGRSLRGGLSWGF